MSEPRKAVVQCPNCRFANRAGEARCLICKADLKPSGDSQPAASRPPATATNAAAAARATAAAPHGVIRRLVDPTKPSEATQAAKREHGATEIRKAVDESLLSASAPPEKAPPVEAPPKPLTRRVGKAVVVAPEEAVAWLWCDPLPPIPLVAGKQVIVGRQDTCDLVLPHKEVSRAHAVFKVSGKQISLEDQGSSNGCYVNGKRSANAVVKVGDQIQIGPYEIDVRAVSEDTGAEKAGETKSLDFTSINSGGIGASMTGRLSEVPLVEILQSIEFNHKTCTLSISDGKLKGRMVFAEGRPMTASYGGERDMDAVRAMLNLKDGRFVLSNEIEAGEPTLSTTVTALLLDVARGQDEALAPAAGAEPFTSEPPAASAYESNSYQLNPNLAVTQQSEEASPMLPTDAPSDAPAEPAAEPSATDAPADAPSEPPPAEG